MATRSRAQDAFIADGAGQGLSRGDLAVLAYVDRLYLYRLTVERQDIFEAQQDQPGRIVDVDDCGQVAIAFDAGGAEHVFWVEPRWLRRQPL